MRSVLTTLVVLSLVESSAAQNRYKDTGSAGRLRVALNRMIAAAVRGVNTRQQ